MKLNKRLQVIASFVTTKHVYDVGCDHALLDIYLEQLGVCCYPSDISENALKQAFKNIKKYHLEDNIKPMVSNGVENIDIKPNSTIVLSGMGTSTIIEILENKKTRGHTLILQSNTELDKLRSYIMQSKRKITEEVVCKDKDIFYVTMKVEEGISSYDHLDLVFGPILRRDTSFDSYMYFLNEKEKRYTILKKMPRKYLGKRRMLKKEIKVLKKKLKKEGRTYG